MMQAKMYKPQKFEPPTLASAEDKEITSYGNGTPATPVRADLSAYNEAAGIKPQSNPLQPYMDVMAEQNAVPKAQTVSNPVSKPQAMAVTSEIGRPADLPAPPAVSEKPASGATLENYLPAYEASKGMSASGTVSNKPLTATVNTGTLEDYMPAYEASKNAGTGYAPMSATATGGESGTTNAGYTWDSDLENLNNKWGGSFSGINRDDLDEDKRELYDLDKTAYDSITYAQRKAQQAIDEVERQRKIQLQQAEINSELAKKYMPYYLKAAGMGGLGVSQSTLAQMANDYQNSISGINSETESVKRGTLDDYKDDLFNLNQSWNTNRLATEETQKVKREERDAQRNDLLFSFNEVFDNPKNYLSSEDNKLDQFLTADSYYFLKSELERNKEILGNRYEEYVEKLEQKSMKSFVQKGLEEARNIILKEIAATGNDEYYWGLYELCKKELLDLLKQNGYDVNI